MLNIKENYIQIRDLSTQQALKNVNDNLRKVSNQLKSINEKICILRLYPKKVLGLYQPLAKL